MQEETVDEDTDPLTSEGLFVFCGSGGCVDVAIGNRVTVEGNVDDFFGLTQLDNDRDNLSVTVDDSGNHLSLITPAVLAFPLADVAVLESVEGMSVRVSSDMRVTEYFNFDRFGELLLWSDGTGAERPYQPTQVTAPATVDPVTVAADFARQSLLLDDGLGSQNVGMPFPVNEFGSPVFGDDSYAPMATESGYAGLRGGDRVAGIEGVLSYGFDRYRLLIADPSAGTATDGQPFDLTIDNRNPRPVAPEAVGGTLRVASLNVLNYFVSLDQGPDDCGPARNLECRGADSAEELARQQAKIVAALAGLDADVVGLVEIENTAGVAAEATLAAALSAATGRPYAAIETGTLGTDAIKVALIYDTARVALRGEHAILDTPDFVDPLNSGQGKNRAALAQTVRALNGNGDVTVVINHLKSKGSGCGPGDDDPVQGNCNATRVAAAAVLADWLAADPTDSGDSDVLILGDLNSYALEDPIRRLSDAGFTDLAAQFIGDRAYGYVFDGRWGTLDYALASASLLPQVTGVTEWHINADEPDALDYDTTFNPPAWYAADAFRASDHDPVLVGLPLTPKTPASKDDCKRDGWKALFSSEGVPFKNQGACVSYVASGKAQGESRGNGKGSGKGK
jgi:predicted extracellular nuclease